MSAVRGVYLAYPIDQRTASMAFMFDQIDRFKVEVLDNGLADWVYDPGDAFRVNRQPQDDGVALINRAALNSSDLVVAFLPRDTPTIGVPMEIDRAHAQGKHVIVFSDAPSYMLHLPNVIRYEDWRDDHVDLAFGRIAQMEPPNESRQFADLRFKVDEPGCLPKRSYDDDAGLDLVVSATTVILPGTFEDVPCGVSVELPGHVWGLVTGRSSALRKRGLLVHSGVIDPGYRGPLFAGAWNMTDQPVKIEAGERVAQLILMGNQTRYHTPLAVDSLSPSLRGLRGFGSTGL